MTIYPITAIAVGILAVTLATKCSADILPNEVGIPVYTRHLHKPEVFNPYTKGIYGMWDITEYKGINIRALGAIVTLSTDRPGYIAGLVAEGKYLYTSLNIVKGYRLITYDAEPTGDPLRVCNSTGCFFKNYHDDVRIFPQIGVKYDFSNGTRMRLTYQPKRPGSFDSQTFGSPREETSSASVTLWVGKSF